MVQSSLGEAPASLPPQRGRRAQMQSSDAELRCEKDAPELASDFCVVRSFGDPWGVCIDSEVISQHDFLLRQIDPLKPEMYQEVRPGRAKTSNFILFFYVR